MMNIFLYGLLLSAMLFPSGGYAAKSRENHARHGEAETNPLVEEMVVLDSAFRKVVSAVALGDGARVHEALESMHGAMEKTHEGVHAGTVTLPKNNDRIEKFAEMDRKFHQKLEVLAKAGERNDRKKMLALTKQLFDGCVDCHRTFRK